MLSKSFVTLCKCRWREFRREPSAFFWVIFMPLLWMVILGLSFSKPRQERYGIAILNKTPLLESLHNDPTLSVLIASPEQLELHLKRGDVVIGVKQMGEKITYFLDPTNP